MAGENKILYPLIGIVSILIVVTSIFAFMIEGNSKKNKPVSKQQLEKTVQLPPSQVNSDIITKNPNLPPVNKYNFVYTYNFTVKGFVKNFIFEIPIPQNEYEKQIISNLSITPKPTNIIKDEDNTVIKYEIPSINTNNFQIIIKGTADLRTYTINTAKQLNNKGVGIYSKKYLEPEKLIESNDSYIKNIAATIKGETKEEIIENTYKYLQNNMKYKIISTNVGAKKALEQGFGKCSEYAAIMTAILRAKKIPARIVSGNIARNQFTQHNWVEVYYDDYGWVTYDPTILPTRVTVAAPDGKILRVEKRYDVSHEDVQYIKSGINNFNSYKFTYSVNSQKGGTVSVKENISIKKFETASL